MTQAQKPSSCDDFAVYELVSGWQFPLYGPDGRPTLQFVAAMLFVSAMLANGCLGGAIADELGLTREAVRDMLGDILTGAPLLGANAIAAFEKRVSEWAGPVSVPLTVDVANQMFQVAAALIEASAVDGVVMAGSTIRLPDDVHLKVEPGTMDGLKPVNVLAAAFAWLSHCLLTFAQAHGNDDPEPAAPAIPERRSAFGLALEAGLKCFADSLTPHTAMPPPGTTLH